MYEVYEVLQIRPRVHPLTGVTSWNYLEHWLQPKDSSSRQAVPHQLAFTTMTFQIMPGIVNLNAHVWHTMFFRTYGGDLRHHVI